MSSVLEQADGYLELGMAQAAWDALESLSPEERAHPLVLGLRVHIFLTLDRFEEARLVADNLVKTCPGDAASWLSLARVEAAVGRIEMAKGHLRSAFDLDPSLRGRVLDDPSFNSVWE